MAKSECRATEKRKWNTFNSSEPVCEMNWYRCGMFGSERQLWFGMKPIKKNAELRQ